MRNAVVTVFGGSGFIGRHFIRRLAATGARIRVPSRLPDAAIFLKPMGSVGQIVFEPFDAANDKLLRALVDGATHVVNLIGILHEKRAGDFVRVHAELPGRIAGQAAAAGVQRLVQISALGASDDSPSIYARTKMAGEAAVRTAFPEATILRPSIVVGPEDSFFNRFAAMARISPVLPLIGGGQTRFQPIYVGDVADALMAALFRDDARGQTYELGGPRVYTFRELMQYMLTVVRRRRHLLSIPWGAAEWQARLLELLPDPLLTRDQVRLLRHDNVVGGSAPGLKELEIVPTPIEAVVPGYLLPYFGQGTVAPPAR
jgi:NADH dehydrogenase